MFAALSLRERDLRIARQLAALGDHAGARALFARHGQMYVPAVRS